MEDPLAIPSTSGLTKRKSSLYGVEEVPDKRKSITSADQIIIRNPSIASSCGTAEVTNSVFDDEMQLSLHAGASIIVENSPAQEENCIAITSKGADQKGKTQIPPTQEPGLSAAMKFSRFEINWKQIPNDVMDQLKGRQPDAGYKGISQTNYNRFVDHVIAQIRIICTKIPFNLIKKVALTITQKYPTLRDCDDDGNVIGDGSNSLADKLRNHNSYLNRAYRSEHQVASKKHCFKRQCKVGVRVEYYKNSKKHCNKEHLLLLTRMDTYTSLLDEHVLSSTEGFVRYKIDSCITLTALHKELPAIRRNELLNFHFQKATGCNADIFSTNYKEKKTKLIEVSKLFKKPLHILTNANDLDVIEGVAKLLNESTTSLIHTVEVRYLSTAAFRFPN